MAVDVDPVRRIADVEREAHEALRPENLLRLDGTKKGVPSSSEVDLEGGAELVAHLNSQLLLGVRQLREQEAHYRRLSLELERLLRVARCCPNCGVQS